MLFPDPSNPESLKQDKEQGAGSGPSGSMVACEIVDTGAHLEPPWTLPVWEKLLAQPWSSIFHENLGIFRLHTWRLSQGIQDAEFSMKWTELQTPHYFYKRL